MAVIDMEELLSTSASANTTEEIPWAEQTITGGFRMWQVLFIAGGALMMLSPFCSKVFCVHNRCNHYSNYNFLIQVIVMCCCFRIRIPRTKQEIDADFRRKQLAKRFRQELKRIRNSELDVMDLKRGSIILYYLNIH